ncbi:helix-turn-helix domain-containing protein [Blastococcus brunescens]|uniref:helix-turn-helix domain-containing protein n=1 Tax=Blastococcus brunescens TaxID=1564165 RepID=UPI003BEF4C20
MCHRSGFTESAAKGTRGWRDEEWAASGSALAERGLLDEAGLTADGEELRRRIEVQTDALAADPWLSLGAEKTARVVELGKGLSRRVAEAGAFGQGIFGR